MRYSSLQVFMFLNVFCMSGALFGMELGKEPTYLYEFDAVLDNIAVPDKGPYDLPDTFWVFRAYNGQNPNPMPPRLKKAQQAP